MAVGASPSPRPSHRGRGDVKIPRSLLRGGSFIFLGSGTVFALTDNGDNTITDSRTSLVWQKQDDGTTRTWEDAITYCEGLTLAGQSDWRMPNIKELITIVDYTTANPEINWTYFPNTHATVYWSSSTGADFTFTAWSLHFGYGTSDTSDKTTFPEYVRCVRGGQ